MKRVISGFMCAMNNCNENSRVNDHHAFFVFHLIQKGIVWQFLIYT